MSYEENNNVMNDESTISEETIMNDKNNNDEETIYDKNKKIIEQCKIETFDDLLNNVNINDNITIKGFNEKLIRGIYTYGFENPSYIQKIGIRCIATGKDVIAQAQSGTGKTGAFAMGLLNNIDEKTNEIQGIILVHTYEMVLQINSVIDELSKYTNIRKTICAKGISVHDNIDLIMGGINNLKPHILIGTPGRTLDMLNRTNNDGNFIINTETIKTLVMDEADELLGTSNKPSYKKDKGKSNNFIKQVSDIVKILPEDIQICLFSATMNESFFKLTKKFMRDPLKILLKTEEITLEGISQYFIDIDEYHKISIIFDLYNLLSISKCVIYCNNKHRVDKLYDTLTNENYMVSIIHSDLSAKERDDAMKKFRRNETNILISTDLIGRGIDIQQLSTIINYDIPYKAENYIHRIGRSGRHGRKGVAINLVTQRDKPKIDFICSHFNTQINPLPDNVSEIIKSVE